ncbi:MAG: metal-sensitive transcriptional regulator [Actinomycetaceae bacterium]|nr:metal-sensitive transcriptional regulator [Actinomycetaceae bacterium]
MPDGYGFTKEQYLVRLRRIEGQVRGLHRMIDQDSPCTDILTQIAAVRSALDAVALGLVEEHVRNCVAAAAKQSDELVAERAREATQAIERLVKS